MINDPGTPFVEPPVISKKSVVERVTESEWEAIELAMVIDPADNQAKKKAAARLRGIMRRFDANTAFNLDDPFIPTLFSTLEQQGIIPAGRAAEITTKVVKERERGKQ